MPDGELLSADTWDRLLVPGDDAPDTRLAEALCPDLHGEPPVAYDVVERVLACIAIGESEAFAWVSGPSRQRAEIDAALEALAQRLTAAEQEWRQRPTAQSLRDAHAGETVARRGRDLQAERLERAREALDIAREALEKQRGELYQAAEDPAPACRA